MTNINDEAGERDDDYQRWVLTGFYYACGRNDCINAFYRVPFVDPTAFAMAFAHHRMADVRHHQSVQDFFTDFLAPLYAHNPKEAE